MTEPISLFKTPEGQALTLAVYEAALAHWPVPYEQLDVSTRFGSTHIIASGPKMDLHWSSCMGNGQPPPCGCPLSLN